VFCAQAPNVPGRPGARELGEVGRGRSCGRVFAGYVNRLSARAVGVHDQLMDAVSWEQLVITAVTVTGTLGGVGLGGWINARSQREHWQREREDLAREHRRSTYAEFVLVATECRRLLQQLFYFQQVTRDAEILATGEEYNRRNRDRSPGETILQRVSFLRAAASQKPSTSRIPCRWTAPVVSF